eukprot:TRINITY_DN7769_c0_g1::TRINITY_DN7769_c0_g1_i1::g.8186::m.8186 TRINITY_DN7769_c0_g1::TRINITY_DN7769_c0_g1_i1::g.8186  ORF type:complete len:457 (+),score=161.58 TRINITY_DN7769_c0_g1_i1:59-1429(+)
MLENHMEGDIEAGDVDIDVESFEPHAKKKKKHLSEFQPISMLECLGNLPGLCKKGPIMQYKIKKGEEEDDEDADLGDSSRYNTLLVFFGALFMGFLIYMLNNSLSPKVTSFDAEFRDPYEWPAVSVCSPIPAGTTVDNYVFLPDTNFGCEVFTNHDLAMVQWQGDMDQCTPEYQVIGDNELLCYDVAPTAELETADTTSYMLSLTGKSYYSSVQTDGTVIRIPPLYQTVGFRKAGTPLDTADYIYVGLKSPLSLGVTLTVFDPEESDAVHSYSVTPSTMDWGYEGLDADSNWNYAVSVNTLLVYSIKIEDSWYQAFSNFGGTWGTVDLGLSWFLFGVYWMWNYRVVRRQVAKASKKATKATTKVTKKAAAKAADRLSTHIPHHGKRSSKTQEEMQAHASDASLSVPANQAPVHSDPSGAYRNTAQRGSASGLEMGAPTAKNSPGSLPHVITDDVAE